MGIGVKPDEQIDGAKRNQNAHHQFAQKIFHQHGFQSEGADRGFDKVQNDAGCDGQKQVGFLIRYNNPTFFFLHNSQ